MVPELRQQWKLGLVLLLILALRCVSLGWLALSDPTESRYADIALRMLESKQWIVPEIIIHDQQVPYWGKPPLHFWLTAISFHLFGISEWSSRFPSFLSGLVMIVMTFLLSLRLRGLREALMACIILVSSGLFFVLSSASVIDVTLSATLTGAMVCFALSAIGGNKNLWGILFFAFLGAGMLAKGPIAPLLALLSIGVWAAITRQWIAIKNLPWIFGTVVFLAISVPWYALAELKSPGFLRYFFVNEHILRYLVHDYGDKYGSGHSYPRGASLVMLLLTFLPWTGALILTIRRNSKTLSSDHWTTYLLSWGLTPAIFFVISPQILANYLLPGFPALAIAISSELSKIRLDRAWRLVLNGQILLVIALSLAAVIAARLYHLSPLFLAATSLMIVTVFIIYRLLHAESTCTAVSLTAVGFALVISVCTLCFREIIDEKNSTKSVMVSILKSGSSKNSMIFPFGVPYSAVFYEEMLLHRSTLLQQQNALNHPDAISVFTGRQWDTLTPANKKQLHPIYQTANWVACRSRP